MNVLYTLTSFAADLKLDVGTGSDSTQANIPQVGSNDLVNNALNITYFLAGAICVIVIIIAGMTYVTGGSNPESIKRAKNMLLYAIIGLIMVLVAFAITWFVIGRI